MKKILLSIYILSLALFGLSCSDYLDKLPEGDMTIDDAFADHKYAKRFLANTYIHLPAEINMMCGENDTWARNPFTAGCDEMEIAYGGAASHLLNSGSLNTSNVQNISPVWSECYMGIRKANIVIENADKIPLLSAGGHAYTDVFDETDRNQLKGEAYFLRAFAYYQLIRTFGPVPIIDRVLPTSTTEAIKRATLTECIDFVIKDCETAISLLPVVRYTGDDKDKSGRASIGAALALKSRMLLYAASPIYNGHPHFVDFKDQDGVNLFPVTKDESKWEVAAKASLDCIQQLEAVGHKLYQNKDNLVDNYRSILLESNNEELIFWRNLDWYNHFDNCSNILSLRGFSILNPTQEMVDSYQMANGTSPISGYNTDGSPIINTASGYQETGYTSTASPEGYWPAGVHNMYVDREVRFYASVQFAGQKWRNTTCDFWYTGKDGRKGAGSDYCKTGYLLAKIVNPSVDVANGSGYERRFWVYFRLAEIYLNYAEALNEWQGPVADVYTYVNKIRNRVGLPNLKSGLSKDEMRKAIHLERRLELAFENHRYFDSRRWGLAETTENKPIHSMNIMAGTHLQDDAYYKRIVVEPRAFEKKHYWFPIPQDDINKSKHVLKQNPGWTVDE